jgi:hypothetical protein
LRFDFKGGTAKEMLADVEAVKITFQEPAGFELLIAHPDWREPIVQLYHNDVAVTESGVKAAADKVLEVAIPFQGVAIATDDPIHFVVELIKDEQSIERLPHEGAIETLVPSPDYEMVMWQA